MNRANAFTGTRQELRAPPTASIVLLPAPRFGLHFGATPSGAGTAAWGPPPGCDVATAAGGSRFASLPFKSRSLSDGG